MLILESTSQIMEQNHTTVETSISSHEPINGTNKDKQSSKTQEQQLKRIFKIIVIGDSNVGKTCLTYRFCGGKFLPRSEATIGVDFREKTVQIEDESIKLQIWDTGSLLQIY
jgi:GTP-binding protein EngB required for normal cell division